MASVAITPAPADGKERSASVNSEVGAGKWKAIRLRSLPKGTKLSLSVTVSGEAAIVLLDGKGYAKLPRFDRALFEGRTSDTIGFKAIIPKAGNYYLVIDNRWGIEPRKFKVAVSASITGSVVRSVSRANEMLGKLENQLKRLFIFQSLDLKLAKCGTANAFTRDNVIILCTELGSRLYADIGDKAKAQSALLFILLHEVGHVLMHQWGYPFASNEELADEFATVLLVMFDQKHRARIQAEYFASRPTTREVELKLIKDDRHPLSVQRARNILRWIEDGKLIQKWQSILVPHLQTAVLEKLSIEAKPWAIKSLVEKELAKRQQPK